MKGICEAQCIGRTGGEAPVDSVFDSKWEEIPDCMMICIEKKLDRRMHGQPGLERINEASRSGVYELGRLRVPRGPVFSSLPEPPPTWLRVLCLTLTPATTQTVVMSIT